ncbi:MAG: hypothetical protein ACKO2N_22960 [Tabrizicola sp.]
MTWHVYLLIIPTVLLSAFIFLAFGFLGLCTMSSCLSQSTSTSTSIEYKLIGAAVAVAASLPLIAALTVLFAQIRKKQLSALSRTLIWTLTVLVGALGCIQVLIDPGDAFWAGIPLLIFSALFALCMKSLQRPQ